MLDVKNNFLPINTQTPNAEPLTATTAKDPAAETAKVEESAPAADQPNPTSTPTVTTGKEAQQIFRSTPASIQFEEAIRNKLTGATSQKPTTVTANSSDRSTPSPVGVGTVARDSSGDSRMDLGTGLKGEQVVGLFMPGNNSIRYYDRQTLQSINPDHLKPSQKEAFRQALGAQAAQAQEEGAGSSLQGPVGEGGRHSQTLVGLNGQPFTLDLNENQTAEHLGADPNAPGYGLIALKTPGEETRYLRRVEQPLPFVGGGVGILSKLDAAQVPANLREGSGGSDLGALSKLNQRDGTGGTPVTADRLKKNSVGDYSLLLGQGLGGEDVVGIYEPKNDQIRYFDRANLEYLAADDVAPTMRNRFRQALGTLGSTAREEGANTSLFGAVGDRGKAQVSLKDASGAPFSLELNAGQKAQVLGPGRTPGRSLIAVDTPGESTRYFERLDRGGGFTPAASAGYLIALDRATVDSILKRS